MTHLKFSYFPLCGHYSVNPPERVPCTPNPKDPSTCRVCTHPDPEQRRGEVVSMEQESATCGKTTCRNAMDQRIHAGNYHTAAGGFDASNARTAGYNDAGQVRYAAHGNGFLRTTEGIMDQGVWAGGKAGGSSGAASSSRTGGKDGKGKKEEKGKGKGKEKEKGKDKAKEKEKAKDKGRDKKDKGKKK